MFPVDAEVSETFSANLPAIEERIVAALAWQMDANIAREQAEVQGKLSGEVLKVRTGRLLGSVKPEPATVQGTSIVGALEAGAGAPEGIFQELGTSGPYTIEARVAKALVFEVGGEVVFARRVEHPGLPARSFMRSTAEDLRDQEFADYQAAVARALA